MGHNNIFFKKQTKKGFSIKEVNADVPGHFLNCFTLRVIAPPAVVLQKGQVEHGDLPEGAAGLDMVTSSVLLKCRN